MSGAHDIRRRRAEDFRAIPRPANDRYAEVVVGGIKTACVTRVQMTGLMIQDCLAARSTRQAPKLVFASNGHAIAMAATDAKFRAHFEAADLVHADGQPVVLASRLAGARRRCPSAAPRPNSSTMPAKAALANGLKIFLLGATEAVNARCAEILRAAYPGLKIAGRRNGFWERDEEQAVCDEVNRSGADILFVGLSVPFEYEFCVRNKARLKAGWLVTCGGCYNFVTGDYKRAPQWMQRHALEWLYRLVREPKRLFWRYAITNPLALFFMATRTA